MLSICLYYSEREGTLGVPHSLGIHILTAFINIMARDLKHGVCLDTWWCRTYCAGVKSKEHIVTFFVCLCTVLQKI